jgi:hypothetical protein
LGILEIIVKDIKKDQEGVVVQFGQRKFGTFILETDTYLAGVGRFKVRFGEGIAPTLGGSP